MSNRFEFGWLTISRRGNHSIAEWECPAGHFLTGDKVCGLQCLICKSIMLPIAFHFVHILRLLQVYAELDNVVPSLASCIVIPVPHNFG